MILGYFCYCVCPHNISLIRPESATQVDHNYKVAGPRHVTYPKNIILVLILSFHTAWIL